MDHEPERMDPRCDSGGRGYMLWMEYRDDGGYVRATDYDALAAKLAEVEAERDAAMREALREALMLATTLHRAEAAEARIAHLENHIEATAKDTHKIMLQYEAALPAVYRLALEKCEAACQIEIDRGDKNNASAYAVGARSCQAAIRSLFTPTAAELMARIQKGEKE